MKRLIITAILWIVISQANAQVTFYASGYAALDDSTGAVLATSTKRQIYNVSFKDKLLVHTVFDEKEDKISDSQVYQIENMDVSGDNVFTFSAKSGLSGNSYIYRMNLGDMSKSIFEQLYKEDKYTVRFSGAYSSLKTFVQ